MVARLLVDHHSNVSSLNISTSFIDNPLVDLEFDRHPVLETFCADGKAENWEDIFEELPEEYVKDINSYAKENLIKLRVFISTPFATEYTRSIETTRTSFIANIGGEVVSSSCSSSLFKVAKKIKSNNHHKGHTQFTITTVLTPVERLDVKSIFLLLAKSKQGLEVTVRTILQV